MKIVYIASSTIPGKAANSVHVMKMCEAFRSIGADIKLIVSACKDKELDQDVFRYYGIQDRFDLVRVKAIKKTPYGIRNVFFTIGAVVKSLKYKPDYYYTRNAFVARVLTSLRKKVIFEYHGIKVSKRFNMQKVFDSSYLTYFVVISEALKQYYVEHYNIDRKKIKVLPDGVNLANFENVQENRSLLQDEQLNVGYVGSLYKGRGIDIVIKMAMLDTRNRYTIVGGTEAQVAEWKEIASECSSPVTFMGHVDASKVPEILMQQDVLLMPYQTKVEVNGGEDTAKWMSPMKMFEYMASGRVIISSDIPVIKEVLEHKRNAYLVNPEDADEWYATIKYIEENKHEAIDIAYNAKRDAREYTWKKRADGILQMLSEDL